VGPKAGLDGWKISPPSPPKFDPRTGNSQLLYRLSYPVSAMYLGIFMSKVIGTVYNTTSNTIKKGDNGRLKKG
jgi:hypothetical protein